MKGNIRTDLALEAHELTKNEGEQIEGVAVYERDEDGIKISRVEVINKNGERAIGKAVGNYVTIECPNLKYSYEEYEKVCRIISDEIKAMANISADSVTLVAGLGNRDITPDALGVEVTSHIMVTQHLKKHMREYLEDNISGVCTVNPGVLGTTGIETVSIIKSVSKEVNPQLIIAVDALAAADIKRVSTTIQISDAGIQPGSGVGNDREGINSETTGAKVIAIGMPTVIDARNISDIEIPQELSPLMVTTKDIDLVIKKCSKTIADGINLALHPNISLDEIVSFMG